MIRLAAGFIFFPHSDRISTKREVGGGIDNYSSPTSQILGRVPSCSTQQPAREAAKTLRVCWVCWVRKTHWCLNWCWCYAGLSWRHTGTQRTLPPGYSWCHVSSLGALGKQGWHNTLATLSWRNYTFHSLNVFFVPFMWCYLWCYNSSRSQYDVVMNHQLQPWPDSFDVSHVTADFPFDPALCLFDVVSCLSSFINLSWGRSSLQPSNWHNYRRTFVNIHLSPATSC